MRAAREWATVDGVTAVALAVAGQLEVWSPRLVPGVGEVVGNRPILAVTTLAATLPLSVRRRWPLGVLTMVLVALVAQRALTTPTQGLVLLVAAMIAAYSSSAHGSLRRAGWAAAVVMAGATSIGEDLGDRSFLVVVLGGSWLVGFMVGRRSSDLSLAREDNLNLSARLAEAAAQLAEAQRRSGSGPVPAGLPTLTPREVEVACAIARGMSNGEIAAELFLSEWTVKTHVGSILRKLGLRDRAQVVVAVYESGLVEPGSSSRRSRSS